MSFRIGGDFGCFWMVKEGHLTLITGLGSY